MAQCAMFFCSLTPYVALLFNLVNFEQFNSLILFAPELSDNFALHEVLGKATWSIFECMVFIFYIDFFPLSHEEFFLIAFPSFLSGCRVPWWYKLGITCCSNMPIIPKCTAKHASIALFPCLHPMAVAKPCDAL